MALDAALATQSKSQLAYDFIKARIEASSYTPGYRLVLGAIASELGVSVVPVREAIRRLEAEGLVQFERNVGAQVAMADPREYEVTMQTLSLVEGWATAASAPFVTVNDVARARAINDQLAQSLHHFDPVAFTRLNLDFHSVLFEHCPNPHILDLVDRGWARLRALRESTFSFVPGRARESVAEHTRILDLIENRADPVELEFAARNHRLATLEAFLAHDAARSSLREPQGTKNQKPFPEEVAQRPSRREQPQSQESS
ncbi:MAG: GntR family transcriptional regulator [Microbacteriaceae bacterium]|nr:GntR family transcriptional regulator [Microbacteriaceae bacterium]